MSLLVHASDGQDSDAAGALRDSSADTRDRTARERDLAGDERDLASNERDHIADLRDQAGDQRDRVADLRDRAGDERDTAAGLRDDVAERLEADARPAISGEALNRFRLVRAEAASDRQVSAVDREQNARDRQNSAAERLKSGLDRFTASADRDAGDTERGHARTDRTAASADRGESAADREAAHFDELTGAYRRGSGFLQLEREVARASRNDLPLAVAFVDVDGLKVVNDSLGHAAGDRLLRNVSNALKSRLRPYDLVIRYGGDEFLCVMDGLDAATARARLANINVALQGLAAEASVSVGVADLRPEESAGELVRRADDALYRARDEASAQADSHE